MMALWLSSQFERRCLVADEPVDMDEAITSLSKRNLHTKSRLRRSKDSNRSVTLTLLKVD